MGWGAISHNNKSSEKFLCRAFILGWLCLASFPAQATDDSTDDSSPPPQPAAPTAAQLQAEQHRKALLSLGRQFADTIGSRLQEADLYLSGAGKMELAEHKSRTQLPDNEPLIMHATAANNKVYFKEDIYTIKRGHRLFVSLGDFCSSVDLAITVHAEKGTADGWFIHENQTFHLDAKKHEVTLIGKTAVFDPAEIDISDSSNVLVSTALLEQWFGIYFDYDFSGLNLVLTTTQPLPAEEAYNRSKKGNSKSYKEEAAKLPRQEVPYTMASEPYVDMTTATTWTQPPGSPPSSTNTWSAITNSDLAGFNLQTYTSGNLPSLPGNSSPQQPYLNSARMTLGKHDPDGGLLGPMHATSYQMGDISAVNIPLIGGGGQEQGVSVTNLPTDITTQTSTEIHGNAQPNWDVELYRNEVYVNIAHIDISGLYDFQNVQLNLGNNDLKLLFYGPHGEINEEHRHILVDPTMVDKHNGFYSASISRNNITTWSPVPTTSTAPGTGDPNIAATYQYGLGKIGTLDVGVRRHSDNGVERTFSEAGLASLLGYTYLNANVGMDDTTHAATGSLTARRNFGTQSAVLSYVWSSKGYNISSPTSGATAKDATSASLTGPLPGRLLSFDHMNYSLNASDTNNYDGSNVLSLAPSLTTRLQNLSLSGSASFNRNTSSSGVVTEGETASFIGHGFIYGGNWRVTTDYNVKPVFSATDTDFEYDHSLGDKVDTTSEVKYTNSTRITTGSLALNWRASKATVSPSLSVDSTNNMTVGVNVHFGTAADPYSHTYSMYNAYLSGTGGVAARVFYDKNGTGIYEPGDELMPDVVIKALQVHRNATTDTRGVAFIPDISQNTVTDIVADPSTFKDS